MTENSQDIINTRSKYFVLTYFLEDNTNPEHVASEVLTPFVILILQRITTYCMA